MGPTYTEHALHLGAVLPEKARVNVFWPVADKKYAGKPRVTIDQSEIGFCKLGEFITVDVPAGAHVLAVDDVDNGPGRCNVQVDIQGGSSSFYEVARRMEHSQAGALGDILMWIPIFPFNLVGVPVALAGMLAESAGKECGGPFSITPVDEATALSKISGLRLSK